MDLRKAHGLLALGALWLFALPVRAQVPEEADAAAVARGAESFRLRCAICHGVLGTGNGPAAPYLKPRPRDLTFEAFKSSTWPGGWAEGVRRVLREGMPGSPMPRFGALSEPEVVDVIAFLRSLRPPDDEAAHAREPPSARQRGREVYVRLQCAKCHGDTGAGDGPAAAGLVDETGRPASLTDLRRPRSFRSGARPEDVLRVIRLGVPGTPMPAYEESLEGQEALELTWYVQTLSLQNLPLPFPMPMEASP